jgi:hypothetical protein
MQLVLQNGDALLHFVVCHGGLDHQIALLTADRLLTADSKSTT